MNPKDKSDSSVRGMARRLKVSVATVSRALRGHPGVSPDMREKVLALAKQVGYQPNKQLQRYFKTIRHESHAVAFLVGSRIHGCLQSGFSFYLRLQWAVQNALRSRGFHMLLANSATDLMADGNLYAVAEGMADGVIADLDDAVAVERLAAHIPVVLLNIEMRGNRIDAVIPDIERVVRDQMRHLIALGHRRIACFRPRPAAGKPYTAWMDRRFWNEYEQIASEENLELPKAYFQPIDFGMNEHPRAIREFLDRVLCPGIAPTAILTYDMYAGELIGQLGERGLAVPGDVSLIGYDDDTHGTSCPLPLTTFHQDFETMAKVALSLLEARIKERNKPVQVVAVEGALIVRASTAPAVTGSTLKQKERSLP